MFTLLEEISSSSSDLYSLHQSVKIEQNQRFSFPSETIISSFTLLRVEYLLKKCFKHNMVSIPTHKI